ncbi:MAG: hypothetical protein KF914_15005 [Rhizobiaceae bacterium]|nr:hypothetical protein [Rhizobiaceae bacterium]
MIRLLLAALALLAARRIVAENTRRPAIARPKGKGRPAPDDRSWVDVSARLDR